ncbi:MAG: hypothetical protein JXN61_09400 [Sedimentisphaerales bacterium]|nr:hypothetical protein [Sedimentisphaerales bacterium]
MPGRVKATRGQAADGRRRTGDGNTSGKMGWMGGLGGDAPEMRNSPQDALRRNPEIRNNLEI